MDSGGQPLLRDGVSMELQHARLTSLDAKRHLRRSRGVILRAQRQAEWAHDENLKEVQRLQDSKSILKKKEKELAQWRKEHAERLKAMREELVERRKELKRTEQQLVRAKERLIRVRKQLARFKSGEHYEQWHRLESEALNAYERRLKQVKKQKRAAKELKSKLRMRKDDADWLDQGLKEEIQQAQELVDKDMRQVRATHSLWQHSREELDKAKEHYWKASAVSHQRDAAANAFKHRLDSFATTTEPPMPNMTLPDVPRLPA
uniref:Uncharacterized protein n=1 Tax=Alexandrium andersonii TaxID=327968 RepID=A0A7S2HVA1_9DINO|mmetsp:Transcript_75202/g.168415  ORF Transcript_75202/g.168415 Transcript_75202/m.168415 type:complete len:262 (+) Transcript_75202:88-873(+)